MRQVLDVQYDQLLLLAPSVEEWIGPEHPARFIREVVEKMDLKAMKFDTLVRDEGGVAYAPRLLLSAWLYGYFRKVRSTRALEWACREEMGFIWLTGNHRVEQAEYLQARKAVAATGRVDAVARVELLRCATRVASLVVEPCAAFEALRSDATLADRAYADHLAGRGQPADAALLPPGQRGALAGVADPLSRLVAAGVLFQKGLATPQVVVLAIDTASAQGWRRPLLAWLGVAARQADAAGAKEEAARIRRRMDLVTASP